MTSLSITERQRQTLAGLADELIPASDAMPSASQVGVAGPLLDGVLSVRDDLFDDLVSILDAAEGRDPKTEIARLRAAGSGEFDTLAFVVAGGYLMDLKVAQLLNYPFQEALPVDPYDYMRAIEDGLLDPVIERGPIYRPTPPERIEATRGRAQ